MSLVSVRCDVLILEHEGEPIAPGAVPDVITVRSHQLNDDRVRIQVSCGRIVTVRGRDLVTAIENAMRLK